MREWHSKCDRLCFVLSSVTRLMCTWHMTYSCMAQDSLTWGTGLIHIWHVTHPYLGRDAFVCGTWCIYLHDMTPSIGDTPSVSTRSFIYVTWRIRMWDMMLLSTWHTSFHRRHSQCVDTLTHILHMTHLHVRQNSFVCGTWCFYLCDVTPSIGSTPTNIYVVPATGTRFIYTWDMTHSYVGHDSFTFVTCLLSQAAPPPTHTLFSRVGLIICVTWLIHTWDMTHSYVGHDSFICGTCLICMRDMTHSHVWHDSFIRGTWLIHMWDMTHLYVGHVFFVWGTWLIYLCDMTSLIGTTSTDISISPSNRIHTWHTTHSYMGHDSLMCGTCLICMRDVTHL